MPPHPARPRTSKHRLLLAVVATDATFEPTTVGGEPAWSGKCIHCNARLLVAADGEPISRATIEHLIPSNHGGTNDLENLAVACARCNSEKGMRHDHKPKSDARRLEVVADLSRKRMTRWRDPA